MCGEMVGGGVDEEVREGHVVVVWGGGCGGVGVGVGAGREIDVVRSLGLCWWCLGWDGMRARGYGRGYLWVIAVGLLVCVCGWLLLWLVVLWV